MTAGTLYLVPTPLDFGCAPELLTPIKHSLPLETLRSAALLKYWVCENAKSARAFVKRVGEHAPLPCTLQEMAFAELPRSLHKNGDAAAWGTSKNKSKVKSQDATNTPATVQAELRQLLQPALDGNDVGLVSEAGMPAVADPGAALVRLAHELGITVQPLVGPLSLMLALASSGLNGQNFAFVGYLPQDKAERAQRIGHLQEVSQRTGQTQICIETPYRNTALLNALLQHLQPSAYLSVSLGLCTPAALTHSATVAQWRRRSEENERQFDWNLPAVFCWGL